MCCQSLLRPFLILSHRMPVHDPWPEACGDLEIVANEWKGEYGVEIGKELALRSPGEPLRW